MAYSVVLIYRYVVTDQSQGNRISSHTRHFTKNMNHWEGERDRTACPEFIALFRHFSNSPHNEKRLAMIQVSDSTKIFLIPPKFTRQCKCLNNIDNLSKSSTYAVVLTNEVPYLNRHTTTSDDLHIDDDMF